MTSTPLADVRPTDDPQRDGAFRVREEVFVEEQRVPAEEEWDEYDARCAHFVAHDAGGAVGTVRMLTGADAVAQGGTEDGAVLGRLAVLRRARGTGLGAALVRAVEAEARRRGLVRVDLHAQVQALGFYERLGYTARGPEYLEAGIPHRSMSKRLDGAEPSA
ncbi:GNAT family N-acetyltransferase [Allostreptomyces psammosilenae]|uniref:Putative GNAT family N-acyltransferase n=1 Tax=Allostreptomyces psammosilenae TaxID=1892865 RepID=A0A852ZXJ6_9ACTN|nr:GNAT family N-acetyltransferase [Allostreptomyces psammosilenae]NYI07113.1 putative GNAT family N-acyltransferase [Allostreptomyces psammosilenae]